MKPFLRNVTCGVFIKAHNVGIRAHATLDVMVRDYGRPMLSLVHGSVPAGLSAILSTQRCRKMRASPPAQTGHGHLADPASRCRSEHAVGSVAAARLHQPGPPARARGRAESSSRAAWPSPTAKSPSTLWSSWSCQNLVIEWYRSHGPAPRGREGFLVGSRHDHLAQDTDLGCGNILDRSSRPGSCRCDPGLPIRIYVFAHGSGFARPTKFMQLHLDALRIVGWIPQRRVWC